MQAFEFTFELSIKMIRRYLELSETNGQELDEYSFHRLLRLAYERNLIRAEHAVLLDYPKKNLALPATHMMKRRRKTYIGQRSVSCPMLKICS